MNECPMGGPQCPESICDCFSYDFPDNPEEWGKLHPELFVVRGTEDEQS